MSLKYYDAWASVRKTPVNSYSADFTAISNMGFSNAPNVFSDVQKETSYGSKLFSTISQVRVDAVVNTTTGQNLGDDFKRFTFDASFGTPSLGQMFLWQGSYWIGTNTDNYQSLSKSLIVRRCNNILRWKDEYDNLIEEPCILSYVLKEPGDYTTSQMALTSGFVNLFCQRNSNTNQIRENMRFLFGVAGNRAAYRVYGNGRKTYLNSVTSDETSPSVSEFYMGASFINVITDDLENGVADAYRNEYTVTILDGDIIQAADFTKTLSSVVKRNGGVMATDVTWTTDDENIVTVSSDGVIDCIAIGSAKIRCALSENTDVYDEITVYVSETVVDDFEVVITPDNNIIYEGETQTFSCVLTNNGVEDVASFTFVASGVPDDNYTLTAIDGNTFTVYNIEKYLASKLYVTCTSGEHEKIFEINLRGDF